MLRKAIANQAVAENVGFRFNIPVNTFDNGDNLTYTVTQANGSNLPTWLIFNPTTREFSGNSGSGNVGVIEIKVTATDNSNESTSDIFALSVGNVNQPPQLTTNVLTISEGGTVTLSSSNLSATDIDSSNPNLRFTISNAKGGEFQVDGVARENFTQRKVTNGNVQFIHNGDDEAPSYDVTVSDDGLITDSGKVVVSFTNVNDAPTNIVLSNSSVEENSPAAIMGDLTVTDVDSSSFTYTVNDNRFQVVNNQLKLKSGISLDFEIQNSINLEITTIDDGTPSQSFTKDFALTVVNANDAPTNITLSNASVEEGNTAAVIGDLTVNDIDSSNFTYMVNDNRFEVVNAQLKLKAGVSLDFESESNINLEITATDDGTLNQSPNSGSGNLSKPILAADYQKMIGTGFATNWFKSSEPLGLYDRSNLEDIFDAGFRNVRLRSRADLHPADGGANFTQFLNDLELVVDDCIAEGVVPIISWIHHEDEANPTNDAKTAYISWWTAVAEHLKDKNHSLSFNLFTELGDTDDPNVDSLRERPDLYNQWTKEAVAAIRATGGNNTNRILILGSPGKDADSLNLIDQTIYENDPYMMAEWHLYASGPNQTGGQKNWVGNGSDSDRANVTQAIQPALDFALPTYLGAWMPTDNDKGSLTQSEVENFASFFVTELKEAGIPWSLNVLDRYHTTGKNGTWLTAPQDIAGQLINTQQVLEVIQDNIAASIVPNAENDNFSVVTGGTITGNVLSNDVDIDNVLLQVELLNAPSNGSLALDEDGQFIYTHNGAATTDSFVYNVSDGKDSDTATVTITTTVDNTKKSFTKNFAIAVTGVNEAPTNINKAPTNIALSNASVRENDVAAVIGDLTSTDVDSSNFSYAVDDDRFEVTNNKLRLKSGVSLDFEAEREIDLSITSTDDGSPSQSLTKDFVLSVVDVNDTVPELKEGAPELKKGANDIFVISSGNDNPKLSVTLLGQASTSLNEFGVFVLDDEQGTIDGISPGAEGYTQLALGRAKALFSAIPNSPSGFNQKDLTSLMEFESGSRLRFFLVKNSTIDAVQSGVAPLSQVLFSQPSSQEIESLENGKYLISWEDGSGANDFKDLVILAQASAQPVPIGARLQGDSQGELIDLRDITGSVSAQFSLNRESAFDNLIGLYKVTDTSGGIDVDGNSTADVRPGDAGYRQAALRGRIVGLDMTVPNQGATSFSTNLEGGFIYAPFIIANGKAAALLDNNPGNDPGIYFTFLGANSDRTDHIRLLGNNAWGFEDLPSGGDMDYNDVVLRINLNAI
jgi:VCBS repeat-containing protein